MMSDWGLESGDTAALLSSPAGSSIAETYFTLTPNEFVQQPSITQTTTVPGFDDGSDSKKAKLRFIKNLCIHSL